MRIAGIAAVFDDLMCIGFRPTLAGVVVLVIGAIAGWGMAEHETFVLVRGVRLWVERVILRALRHRWWTLRAAAIFLNNGSICGFLIWAGGWPAGSWFSIVIVGLSMGIAIRVLTGNSDMPELEVESELLEDDSETPSKVDGMVVIALLLNLLELPAIVMTVGLSMGQLAAANGLPPADVWRIYLVYVLPALAIAAGAESLWIGRTRPF